MTPEQLVPTLKTCKLLKEIGFKQDTYFKHGKNKMLQFDGRTPLGFAMVEVVNERPEQIIAAAPTLQELLEEFNSINGVEAMAQTYHGRFLVQYEYDNMSESKPKYHTKERIHDNPAEAAALLFLALKSAKETEK